jgi:hypothetical protein
MPIPARARHFVAVAVAIVAAVGLLPVGAGEMTDQSPSAEPPPIPFKLEAFPAREADGKLAQTL